jgi:hypothetical protein
VTQITARLPERVNYLGALSLGTRAAATIGGAVVKRTTQKI